MPRPRFFAASLLLVLAATPILIAAGHADPFDPRAYIGHKEGFKVAEGGHLTSRGIFRIDGQRFQSYSAAEGEVYLLSPDSIPNLSERATVCPQHLRLFTEVIAVRQGLPPDQVAKKHEAAIVALIRKCRQGRIKGPILTETEPDGAVIEVRAKEKAPVAAAAKAKSGPEAASTQ